MEPLGIYNELKGVDKKYIKPITGGRLKGMSDIKPQWRIMKLTELFGPCGIGWKVQNLQFEYKDFGNEVVVNCKLDFYYKFNDVWSEAIPAVGGSKISTMEKNGVYISDEAEKMAYTDALSVAGKMIGLASDIYMGYGGKYDSGNTNVPSTKQNSSQGQNTVKKEVKKDELVVESHAFKKLVDIAPKYTVDQLLAMAKSKYEVSSATEQVIRGLYNDELEEIILDNE
jgi:hypothetical protein